MGLGFHTLIHNRPAINILTEIAININIKTNRMMISTKFIYNINIEDF